MLCASCGAFVKRLYPDPFETDTSLIRAIIFFLQSVFFQCADGSIP